MKYRKAVFAAASVASAALATPANAWVKLQGEGNCGFMGIFEGPGETRMMLRENFDDFQNDTVAIIVMNDNWSLTYDDYVGTIRFLNTLSENWLENEAKAADRSFVIETSFDHVEHVFGSYNFGNLKIYRNGKEIEGLQMENMSSVWRSYEACRRPWVAAREKAKHAEQIEKKYGGDPFAD